MIVVASSGRIRVTTSSAATISCSATWFDYKSGDPVAPGCSNTNISSATTTEIVAAPAASTSRNVKRLFIRNTHATLSDDVTILLDNGTLEVAVYAATLTPGAQLEYTDSVGFETTTNLVEIEPLWATSLLGACTTDPGEQMLHMQRAGNIAATPTNIATTVARCSLVVPIRDITVNRIRWYGVGVTTSIYRVAIYRLSDLARLTAELAFTTAVDTWGSVDAGGITLLADTPYFVACAVNATGTTAGVGCVGGTVAATTGRVNTTPSALPGNMTAANAFLNSYFFQFAVTAGALPNPAATLAAQAAWTGGMPAFWLDNNTSA